MNLEKNNHLNLYLKKFGISSTTSITLFSNSINVIRNSLTDVICIDEFKKTITTYKSRMKEIRNSLIIHPKTYKMLTNGYMGKYKK